MKIFLILKLLINIRFVLDFIGVFYYLNFDYKDYLYIVNRFWGIFGSWRILTFDVNLKICYLQCIL